MAYFWGWMWGIVGAIQYPNLVRATDPALSLTIANASSSANTLKVMLIIAIFGMGQQGGFGVPELTVLVHQMCWSLAQIGRRHLAAVLLHDVDRLLLPTDGRDGFAGGAQDNLLTGGNARQDAPRVVGPEPLRSDGIIAFRSPHLCRSDTRADFHPLDGADAHEGPCEFRIDLFKILLLMA
jgi:hypothetical protein